MGSEWGIQDLDFEARVDLAATTCPRLTLVGNADTSVVASFGELVGRLHRALVAAGASTIEIDIRALEFMSASCFKVFVTWLGLDAEVPVNQRYRLRFQSNSQIPWQRRSLQTLACFETTLIEIVT